MSGRRRQEGGSAPAAGLQRPEEVEEGEDEEGAAERETLGWDSSHNNQRTGMRMR